ncbi:hypothetical protein EWI07_05790 [Sporolactobacillus sp. THM7-4]|nr:hypothetical protein EWI07_05790 [Sporolactobacillus sp. THM7-4]
MDKFTNDSKQRSKDQIKSNSFVNEEFAQPLDEHSVEERERAQRTDNRSNFDLQNQNQNNNK